jgi:thymidine phosphorylase
MLSLTLAMSQVGNQLEWDMPLVVDKHCIGGIPGNRTSMIVVPIVAAHGLPIPKTSSRAITSPAGTADTMEVLAKVDITMTEMRDLVEKEKGCLVWGGHVNLSPADDVLISVERPLGIDTPEQMVASILSKKLAAGSTHLVVDIPVGPTAKVRSQQNAIRLRKMFEYVGGQTGLVLDVVITDGSQPIGRGIGPVLEARDVMAVLRNEPSAPADLRQRALLLAGRILDFDPGLRGGVGHTRACELLESGRALAAMERIIDRQGRSDVDYPLGHLTHDMVSARDGTVTAIDCYRLSRIARLAGAPMDKGAGIDLMKKIGDGIEAGEPLYRIYSCVASDFQFAKALAEEDTGFSVAAFSDAKV